MHLTREQICELTSRKLLAAAPRLPSIKATVGLRVDPDEETIGLDETSHGERAYNS